MTRGLVIIREKEDREFIKRCADQMPKGSRFEIKRPRRSLTQNNKMWAMLTEVSRQLVWHGRRYPPDDWKDYFIHAMRQGRWMPGEDGRMVPVGWRTSDLSDEEFADLITVIEEFGVRHGVHFGDAKLLAGAA